MTKFATNLRLGIKCKGFDLSFWGFCVGNRERQIGLGDEAQFPWSSDWGKEGNHFDALNQVRWIDQTCEELRRARGSQEFSLNR